MNFLLFVFIIVRRLEICRSFRLVRSIHFYGSLLNHNLKNSRGFEEVKLPSAKLIFKKKGGSNSRYSRPQGKNSELTTPNKLRIIGGIAKGRKIESPDVHLRPMMSKVREALFSSLSHLGLFSRDATSVLDIFSGSGSVGLEALSRGAFQATFVDLSKNCVEVSLKNAKMLGFEHQVSAICGNAFDVLSAPSNFSLNVPFDCISLTPPYEEVIYKDLIDATIKSPLIRQNSFVIVEYPEEMHKIPPIIDDSLFGLRNRRYGRTNIAIYVFQPSEQYEFRFDEF